MQHISEEVLEEYVMHTLPRPRVADVEEHILICPDCQERLGAMDTYVESVRGAAAKLEGVAPPDAQLKKRSRKQGA